jgi:S1-C subfamily serine protease
MKPLRDCLTILFFMTLALVLHTPAVHGQAGEDPARDATEILDLEEQAFAEAIELAAASVVRIETFGGLERVGDVTVSEGPTTGVIVSSDGLIVSSSFNFIQKPPSILVTLPGGKRVAAEIVNRDDSRHLVLLKVEATSLPVPNVVPRKELRVGQWSLALGRTLSNDSPNLSVGIISATDRIWGKAVQTDAKISPHNYGGALIDIEGRLIGVLVPMSPQGNSEMAGAEWYDSGIGFAVPLEDIILRLDRLRSGETLKPGLLGVAFKGKDIYADPAEVTLVRVNSPAETAGIREGDVIVEFDGRQVERQAQLRHAIGPLYANDEVNFVVRRGDKDLPLKAVLTDEIPPYTRPFAGILPMRDDKLAVRFVYPDSPAAAAGIVRGDRWMTINKEPLASQEDLHTKLRRLEPGTEIAVQFQRGTDTFDTTLTVQEHPTAPAPAPLPAAWKNDAAKVDDSQEEGEKAAAEAEKPEAEKPEQNNTGRVDIKIPEVANKCEAYIPKSYRPEQPAALLVYLHATGAARADDPLASLIEGAEQSQTIVVCPQSSNERAWRATDVEFVRKVIDQMLTDYQISPQRVAIAGRQAGGAMAYVTTFSNPEVVRGVAPIETGIPQRVNLPETDPVNPIYVATSKFVGKPSEEAAAAAVKRLQDLKYPVTLIPELENFGGAAGSTTPLFLWLDTLDRY